MTANIPAEKGKSAIGQSFYFMFFAKWIRLDSKGYEIKDQTAKCKLKFQIYRGNQLMSNTRQPVPVDLSSGRSKIDKVQLCFFLKDYNVNRQIDFVVKLERITNHGSESMGEINLVANKYIDKFFSQGQNKFQQYHLFDQLRISYIVFVDKSRHQLQKLMKSYKNSVSYIEMCQNQVQKEFIQQARVDDKPNKIENAKQYNKVQEANQHQQVQQKQNMREKQQQRIKQQRNDKLSLAKHEQKQYENDEQNEDKNKQLNQLQKRQSEQIIQVVQIEPQNIKNINKNVTKNQVSEKQQQERGISYYNLQNKIDNNNDEPKINKIKKQEEEEGNIIDNITNTQLQQEFHQTMSKIQKIPLNYEKKFQNLQAQTKRENHVNLKTDKQQNNEKIFFKSENKSKKTNTQEQSIVQEKTRTPQSHNQNKGSSKIGAILKIFLILLFIGISGFYAISFTQVLNKVQSQGLNKKSLNLQKNKKSSKKGKKK